MMPRYRERMFHKLRTEREAALFELPLAGGGKKGTGPFFRSFPRRKKGPVPFFLQPISVGLGLVAALKADIDCDCSTAEAAKA